MTKTHNSYISNDKILDSGASRKQETQGSPMPPLQDNTRALVSANPLSTRPKMIYKQPRSHSCSRATKARLMPQKAGSWPPVVKCRIRISGAKKQIEGTPLFPLQEVVETEQGKGAKELRELIRDLDKWMESHSLATIIEKFPLPPADTELAPHSPEQQIAEPSPSEARTTILSTREEEARTARNKALEQGKASSPRDTFLWPTAKLAVLAETASIVDIRNAGLNVNEPSDDESGCGRVVRIFDPGSGEKTIILQTADLQRVDRPGGKSLIAVNASRVPLKNPVLHTKVSFVTRDQATQLQEQATILKKGTSAQESRRRR